MKNADVDYSKVKFKYFDNDLLNKYQNLKSNIDRNMKGRIVYQLLPDYMNCSGAKNLKLLLEKGRLKSRTKMRKSAQKKLVSEIKVVEKSICKPDEIF